MGGLLEIIFTIFTRFLLWYWEEVWRKSKAAGPEASVVGAETWNAPHVHPVTQIWDKLQRIFDMNEELGKTEALQPKNKTRKQKGFHSQCDFVISSPCSCQCLGSFLAAAGFVSDNKRRFFGVRGGVGYPHSPDRVFPKPASVHSSHESVKRSLFCLSSP